MQGLSSVEAWAVRDLVRARRGDTADHWDLALVQRAPVWDEVRMRYLLDSLLAGYPVGTLMVCRVRTPSHVLPFRATDVAAEAAKPTGWQLLDGQQRINALYSLFTTGGSYGRFLLSMTAQRPVSSGPVTTKRARDRVLNYILWLGDSEADVAVKNRETYIDLSGWCSWAESRAADAMADLDGLVAEIRVNVEATLRGVDDDFCASLDDTSKAVAANRIERLARIWFERHIPVHFLELDSPADVLEVFTRLNRSGVAVAGDDLFFAAVKTWWPQAARALAQMQVLLTPVGSAGPKPAFLGRMDILRVLVRLSAWAADRRDVVPLAVDRLSGPAGVRIRETLAALARTDSVIATRMQNLAYLLGRSSKLGFGLHRVDQRLWDHVFAWAALSEHADGQDSLRAHLDAVDSYLFAATAFSYRGVLGEAFEQMAMREAMWAACSGMTFPTRRISAVARQRFQDLRFGRQQVQSCTTEEDRIRLANRNGELILSVAQGIPYQSQTDDMAQSFDWDHIYPRGQAWRMWVPSSYGARWRPHHRERHHVHGVGNLWALDSGLNRAARHEMPAEKFARLDASAARPDKPCWSPGSTGLTTSERTEFEEVGRLLANGDAPADERAMAMFSGVVRRRALRMLDEVFELLPDVRCYALDAPQEAEPPSPEPSIASAFGASFTDGEHVLGV